MIVRGTAPLEYGVHSFERKGDKLILNHYQNVDGIAEYCKLARKDESRGYAPKKAYRVIAEMPALTFYARPELHERPGKINRKELYKFLRSPEGEMFKTVEKL